MAVGLSRREQEIAELVAEGLTDKQIASRLFISERTVEGHLDHVRSKLGLDNRTQVARWITIWKLERTAGRAGAPVEPASPPGNLPAQLTTFVGRARDLAEVRRLLQRARLVTITGPGGSGKTRLAVQAVEEVPHRYPGGLWLVDLGPAHDRQTVPRAIAAALGVGKPEGTDPLQAVAAALAAGRRRRPALVILDNCEHLLSACAAAAHTLLGTCPDLTFLCTSREPLRVAGEAVWALGPMSLPPAGPAPARGRPRAEIVRQSEAVQLLLDRVSLHVPDFALDEENAEDVAHLCRQLEGIPLALELAAPRIALMSFDEVLGHLERHLGTLAAHGAPGRHQTLRATIDWSYDLLVEAERRLLRRLSVFRGGFTREAAEAVAGGEAGADAEDDTFDLLIQLVQKSLVLPVPPRRERYRCLELIRRYAADRLEESGERDAVRRRHFAHFFAFAERAAGELTGPGQALWLERLAAEQGNLRCALELGRGEDVERRLRLVLALDRFWRVHGPLGEAREWAEQVLQEPEGAPPALRARVLTAAAGFAWHQGDLSSAAAYTEQSLAAWRALGDRPGTQSCLSNLGVIARARGDLETARRCYLESLALARAGGDGRAAGIVLSNLGLAEADLGEHEEARAHLEEALGQMHGLGDLARVAIVLANLGTLALYRDRFDEAGERYAESLRLLASLGARQNVAECLEGLACVAARRGSLERAMRLAGAAAGVREAIGAAAGPSSRRLLESWLQRASDALGASSSRVWAEGRQLAEGDAIQLALAEA